MIVAYVDIHLLTVAVHEPTERRALISAMVSGHKLFSGDELGRHPEIRSEEGEV